jgi:hypothetical protein
MNDSPYACAASSRQPTPSTLKSAAVSRIIVNEKAYTSKITAKFWPFASI